MKPQFRKLVRMSVSAGLCLFALANIHGQDQTEGIVRISSPKSSPVEGDVTPAGFHRANRLQPVAEGCQNQSTCPCEAGGMAGQCPTCRRGVGSRAGCRSCRFQNRTVEDLFCDCFRGNDGYCHDCDKQAMCDYLRCKFGYVCPSGAGGAGIPWVGKYSRVYPQDPYYFDQRDGQTWAAQGYGAPIAVPLAPVVGHSFNYGWGIPSSRLTPISHPAY